MIDRRLAVLFTSNRVEAHKSVHVYLEVGNVDHVVAAIRLDELALSVILPFRKGLSLFLRQSALKRKKLRAFKSRVIQEGLLKLSPSVGVDLDHFQVFIAFLEILSYLKMILMLMSLLEILKQLIQDRIPHLKPSLLGLLEQIVILILEFLALHPPAIEVHLFLVAEMGSAFLFGFFFNHWGSGH